MRVTRIACTALAGLSLSLLVSPLASATAQGTTSPVGQVLVSGGAGEFAIGPLGQSVFYDVDVPGPVPLYEWLYAVPLAGGSPVQLDALMAAVDLNCLAIAVAPDESFAVFVGRPRSNPAAPYGYWKAPTSGGPSTLIAATGGTSFGADSDGYCSVPFQLSPDGTRRSLIAVDAPRAAFAPDSQIVAFAGFPSALVTVPAIGPASAAITQTVASQGLNGFAFVDGSVRVVLLTSPLEVLALDGSTTGTGPVAVGMQPYSIREPGSIWRQPGRNGEPDNRVDRKRPSLALDAQHEGPGLQPERRVVRGRSVPGLYARPRVTRRRAAASAYDGQPVVSP